MLWIGNVILWSIMGVFFLIGRFEVNAPWWDSETLKIPTETKRYDHCYQLVLFGDRKSPGGTSITLYTALMEEKSLIYSTSMQSQALSNGKYPEGAVLGDTTPAAIVLITCAPFRA